MTKTYSVTVNDYGTEIWYLNGKIHRENGPAIIYPDGDKFWYLNSQKLTEQEFLQRTAEPKCPDTVVINGVTYVKQP